MSFCLICDEPVESDGETVIRLIQGTLEHRRWGLHLERFNFEDDDKEKWIHTRCAKRKRIVVAMLKHHHCILCGKVMELDGDGHHGDCVLRIERGVKPPEPLSAFEEPENFEAKHGGYVHFICAVFDNWHLPLRDLQGM
jgi:hypothetical protein